MKKVIWIMRLAVLGLFLSLPAAAAAERFADLSVGGVFSQDEEITVNRSSGSITGDAEFDNSLDLAYRMGYWFENAPWLGVGLEVSHFEPDIAHVTDLRLIPLTPLLMLRIPLLRSDRFPHGEWQPYLAGGPGFVLSIADKDDIDTQFEIGWDARAGLKKMIVEKVGVFVEYRYTNYLLEFDPLIDEFNLQSHHALFGLTVNF